jgi:hypothetical protein
MAKEELEKRNVENLVYFYRDELLSMKEGVRARDLFPKGLRKRLRDFGILVYRHGREGIRYVISSTALELLSSLVPAPSESAI